MNEHLLVGINVLKNEKLLGISFNQETDKEYIENDIMVHLKRKNALRYIQDSDYHGKDGQSIGDMYFYIDNFDVKEDTVNYYLVKNTLHNSLIVRTSSDTATERYSNETKDKIIYSFSNTNLIDVCLEPDAESFLKTVCAITNMNSHKYLVVIEGQLDDKKDKKEAINLYINKLKTLLKDKLLIEQIRTSFYPISKSKIKLVLQISNNSRLNTYNDVCYIIDDDDYSIKAAKSYEIESIVSEKMYNKFGRMKDARLELISEQLGQYSHELKTYACLYKIDDNIRLYNSFSTKVITADDNFQELYKCMAISGNGNFAGNAIVINSDIFSGIKCGRYDDSYIRLTAPYAESDKALSNCVESKTVLITEYGAVIYVENDANILTDVDMISIQLNDENISIKKLIMYMRSTLLLWIITKNYMAYDLYLFMIRFNKPTIPIIDTILNNDSDILEEYFDELCELENEFLKAEKVIIQNKDKYSNEEYDNNLEELVHNHNKNADSIMKKTDKIFYNLCKFNEDDIKQIEYDIGRMKIYCWK